MSETNFIIVILCLNKALLLDVTNMRLFLTNQSALYQHSYAIEIFLYDDTFTIFFSVCTPPDTGDYDYNINALFFQDCVSRCHAIYYTCYLIQDLDNVGGYLCRCP